MQCNIRVSSETSEPTTTTDDAKWGEETQSIINSCGFVMQWQQVVDSRYRFKHLLVKLEEYSGVRMHI